MNPPVLLFCNCQYAQVVPEDVKRAVLKRLCDSGQPFDAVPDLCELSARKDPVLARIAASDSIKIAACFPRAVKWLFHSAGSPLSPERTEVINMRSLNADQCIESLFVPSVVPNLPVKTVNGTPPSAESPPI